MTFADIRPRLEQLPREEMIAALAFLKSRLRVETTANQADLSRLHAEMDAGKRVSWEALKQKLDLR